MSINGYSSCRGNLFSLKTIAHFLNVNINNCSQLKIKLRKTVKPRLISYCFYDVIL